MEEEREEKQRREIGKERERRNGGEKEGNRGER